MGLLGWDAMGRRMQRLAHCAKSGRVRGLCVFCPRTTGKVGTRGAKAPDAESYDSAQIGAWLRPAYPPPWYFNYDPLV